MCFGVISWVCFGFRLVCVVRSLCCALSLFVLRCCGCFVWLCCFVVVLRCVVVVLWCVVVVLGCFVVVLCCVSLMLGCSYCVFV